MPPVVWQPSAQNDHVRQLLHHRCRMVRMRTQIKNQLDSMAKNEGVLSSRVWSAKRRSQIEALPLPGWYAHRRADLLGLLRSVHGDDRFLSVASASADRSDEHGRDHPG